MLRKNQEITEKSALESIIRASLVCRLALSDKGQPYIVPMCFGYCDNTLYFHTGLKGRKLEILKKNSKVCFEFETGVDLVKGETPCTWNMQYQSIIGFGSAAIIEDMVEKRNASAIIVRQYSDKPVQLPDMNLRKIIVIKVSVDSMTGKHSSKGL